MSGNSHFNSSFTNTLRDGERIKMISMDLPFETLEDLSPEKGNICRSVKDLSVFNDETWVNLL